MPTPPSVPYQPYKALHQQLNGPGDARPTATRVLEDCLAGSPSKLRGKTILITGCSSGIGVTTASALYGAGATLYLSARDMSKLDGVIQEILDDNKTVSPKPPRPVPVQMRLESLDSVRKGAAEIRSKISKLDILILNAGVMAVPRGYTQDGFETHIGVNHMAHFLLFHELSGLLEKAAADSGKLSRVVVLSSAGHLASGIRFNDLHYQNEPDEYMKWMAYGQSKTANAYMAASVTNHFGHRGITALAVHPGAIVTELGRHMVEDDYKLIQRSGVKTNTMKSVEQGAATTVWAVASPHFDKLAHGGRYLADVGECGALSEENRRDSAYGPHLYKPDLEERFWNLSCRAVGVVVSRL